MEAVKEQNMELETKLNDKEKHLAAIYKHLGTLKIRIDQGQGRLRHQLLTILFPFLFFL